MSFLSVNIILTFSTTPSLLNHWANISVTCLLLGLAIFKVAQNVQSDTFNFIHHLLLRLVLVLPGLDDNVAEVIKDYVNYNVLNSVSDVSNVASHPPIIIEDELEPSSLAPLRLTAELGSINLPPALVIKQLSNPRLALRSIEASIWRRAEYLYANNPFKDLLRQLTRTDTSYTSSSPSTPLSPQFPDDARIVHPPELAPQSPDALSPLSPPTAPPSYKAEEQIQADFPPPGLTPQNPISVSSSPSPSPQPSEDVVVGDFVLDISYINGTPPDGLFLAAEELLPPAELRSQTPDVQDQAFSHSSSEDRSHFHDAYDTHLDIPAVLKHANETYTIQGKLGQGGFGYVVSAITSKGRPVAIKIICKSSTYILADRECVLNEKMILQMATEEGMSHLTHLLASWDDDTYIYFVMRRYRETLADRRDRGDFKKMSKLEVRLRAAQLVMAVEQQHRLGVIHRDIKPENIFHSDDGDILVGDFGLARVAQSLEDFKTMKVKGRSGTTCYMAPEIFLDKSNTGYRHQVDIWSLGLVLYEMMAGLDQPHFYRKSEEEMITAIHESILNRNVPRLPGVRDKLAKDLISKMVCRAPYRRIKIEDIKKHDYFEGINWTHVEEQQYESPYVPPPPKVDYGVMNFRGYNRPISPSDVAFLESQLAMDRESNVFEYTSPYDALL